MKIRIINNTYKTHIHEKWTLLHHLVRIITIYYTYTVLLEYYYIIMCHFDQIWRFNGSSIKFYVTSQPSIQNDFLWSLFGSREIQQIKLGLNVLK